MPDPEVIVVEKPCFPVEVTNPIDPERTRDVIEVSQEDAERLGPDDAPCDVTVYDYYHQCYVRVVRRECGMHPGCWHEMVATFDHGGETTDKPIALRRME